MRSLVSTMLANKRRAILIGAIAVAVMMVGLVASAQATDQSSFCTTCHEMTPFYSAWAEGAHSSVACIDCHVDAATTKRLAHKVTALGEVWAHFTGEPLFPMNATEVPNERCLRCHDGTIDPGIPGFDHETHRGDQDCQSCHATVGHDVSAAELDDAGVLDPDAQAEKERRTVAAVGQGEANLPGHATVSCSSCHDLAATGCESCHTPGHEPRDVSTTCTDCHTTDAEWAFTHPVGTGCATCHTAPAEHYKPECATCHTTPATFAFEHPAAGANCATCHEAPAEHRPGVCASCHTPGETWTFAHPAASANCATCHTKPAGHYNGTCSACHTPGTAFESTVFKHPGAGANCATCHTKPAKHYGGACSSCHKPGTPFKSAVFKHPGASATCTTCHTKPSGHASASCTSCHRPAASWAFYHPSSTSCASCHNAPSNHYGTSCASCHSPSQSWGSATFSHPRVPGGEHTYRSFSCTSCHPSGYSSVDCNSCHEEDDDDD